MTSAAYVAKRLARLAAELGVELARPTLKDAPYTAWRADLQEARLAIIRASVALNGTASAETPAIAAPEGDSAPVRFAFIAVGIDEGGRGNIYAQDEGGEVWAGDHFGGIARAHRFPTRAAADAVAKTRGGYAYPIPA